MEEQLSLLSIYPEPNSALDEEEDVGDEKVTPTGGSDNSPARAGTQGADSPGRSQAEAAAGGGTPQPGERNLQEKTDEMLRSITTSFATVTDMFGVKDEYPGANKRDSESGSRRGRASEPDRFGGGGNGGGGWDLFKPPSMAEMKKRLEDMAVGGSASLSPPRAPETAVAGEEAGAGVSRTGDDRSMSPATKGQDGGRLSLLGESWRDIRRRSTEAMNDAVTKIRSALDDSDDEDGISTGRDSAGRDSAGRGKSGDRVRAAATRARAARAEDDSFWNPFGDAGEADGLATNGDPVPLPTRDEVRRGKVVEGDDVATRGSSSTKAALQAFYGGGGQS